MNASNNRKDGKAWRRAEHLISLHAKAGKDRSKAGKRKRKKGGKR